MTTDTTTTIDETKVEEFVGKMLTDMSGMTNSILASIGDRLGLWKDLATNGPATSSELAARTGINERYARRVARRHDVGRVPHLRPEDRDVHPSRRARPRARRRGRRTVLLRRPPDDVRDPRRVRAGGREVPIRRRRAPARVPRRHVGRARAVHDRLVQQPPRAGVGAGRARVAGEARGRRRRSPMWGPVGVGAHPSRPGLPEVDVRRLRRLRADHRQGRGQRQGSGGRRQDPLRGARRLQRTARSSTT